MAEDELSGACAFSSSGPARRSWGCSRRRGRTGSGRRSATATRRAPGFRLASRRCIVSTEDEPTIERLAAALRLDGVIAPGSDRPVGVAARVAARLGVAHPISPATAALVVEQAAPARAARVAGVPQPRWEAVGGEPGRARARRASSRRPTARAASARALVLDDAELPRGDRGGARAARGAGAVLVEELVEGPEVTVSALLGRTAS